MAMTLVGTTTVGSGTVGTITFSNIPQTGKDLLILFSLRDTQGAVVSPTTIIFNGSFANYSYRLLRGDGSSVASAGGSSSGSDFARHSGDSSTANTFGNGAAYVTNYTLSAGKTLSVDSVAENNGTSSWQQITAGFWDNSAAITSVSVAAWVNFAQHSSVSLYIIS